MLYPFLNFLYFLFFSRISFRINTVRSIQIDFCIWILSNRLSFVICSSYYDCQYLKYYSTWNGAPRFIFILFLQENRLILFVCLKMYVSVCRCRLSRYKTNQSTINMLIYVNNSFDRKILGIFSRS